MLSGDIKQRTPNTPTGAELEAYKQFAAFHNVQETLFWTRNNILVVLQAGLFAAAFSILTKGKGETDPFIVAVLGIVGFLLAIVWYRMVVRSEYIFRQTLHILSTMEDVLPLRPRFRVFWRFTEYVKTPGEKFDPVRDENGEPLFKDPEGDRSRHRLSFLWKAVGIGFALAWIALVVLSSLPFCRSVAALD